MPHTLVTGANAFVAAHVIAELISLGHTVTGSVRRATAGEDILAEHPEWKGKLDFVTIEDYATEGIWNEVFEKNKFDHASYNPCLCGLSANKLGCSRCGAIT